MKSLIFSSVVLLSGMLAGCESTPPEMTNKCAAVTCAAGQTCNAATGVCEGTINKCAAVSCTFPQSCDMTSGACANPPMPSTTGTLIDRMGRPGVNTALTNPFDVYKPQGAATAELSDVTKDNYNKDGNVAGWTTAWVPAIQQHLGILDGLDGNCTNQFAGGAGATRYQTLATVLANDALTVNMSKTTCNQYLGAEIAFVTAGAVAANDCGGRTLSMDVIDVTYSALATGDPTGMSVKDGIAQNIAPAAYFPFFTNPM